MRVSRTGERLYARDLRGPKKSEAPERSGGACESSSKLPEREPLSI